MVANEATLTWKEFQAYAEQKPDKLIRALGGIVIGKVTQEDHGFYASNIVAALRAWVREYNIKNVVYSVGAWYRVICESEEYVIRPDVTFRLTPYEPSTRILPTSPYLCVEIKSENDTYDDLRKKAKFYLAETNTELVWLVYPKKRLVEVYTHFGSELFTEDENLTYDEMGDGSVMKDFALKVSEIFEM